MAHNNIVMIGVSTARLIVLKQSSGVVKKVLG
jgi:hypothetical protein